MKRRSTVTPEMREKAKEVGIIFAEFDPSLRCEHTPAPEGYNQWHDWAARMEKTHKQIQCPMCGLWAVWVKKVPRRG